MLSFRLSTFFWFAVVGNSTAELTKLILIIHYWHNYASKMCTVAYLAYSIALVSRITLTLISPG
ncbi:MAG: hypothetical protein G01um101444_7 [Parcubacteria group bacterium Gr01-1014_44]|nr:MAG: hypothetical protein G01um101444_7 [Parcubacteria group bacterium Gr01-1014_44]